MNTFLSTCTALILLAGTAAPALAEDCALSIDANDMMQFSTRQLAVPAGCADVQVTLHHVGKQPRSVMGHNWVLTRARDATVIANLGQTAGIGKNYLPAGDARIIAATALVGSGENATVKFSTANLKAGEEYTFFCSAPGHIDMMKGRFILKK